MAKRLRSKRVKRSKLRRKSFKRNIHRRKTKYQKKTMRRRKIIRRKAKYTNRIKNMYGGDSWLRRAWRRRRRQSDGDDGRATARLY